MESTSARSANCRATSLPSPALAPVMRNALLRQGFQLTASTAARMSGTSLRVV